MRGVRVALSLALLLCAGCHRSHPDAVPPEPSGGLVAAPPGALGARAAEPPGAGGAAGIGVEPPDRTPPPAAGGAPEAPPALAPPAGSGVAL